MKDSDPFTNISRKNILVLCAGYPYNTDTAFGSYVAKELQANDLPEHVACFDVGESISEALNLFDRQDKIIIVDVLETNDPPGTLYRLKPEEIVDLVDGTVDLAQYHILQTVYEMRVTGDCGEAVFIGVAPEDTTTVGQTLTHRIHERIPAVIEMIMEEINGQAG